MAMLIKNRARKPLAVTNAVSVNVHDKGVGGLHSLTQENPPAVLLQVGDYRLFLTFEEFDKASKEIAHRRDDMRIARVVLERMMREIAQNDIPSENTWADAYRIVGWKVPPRMKEEPTVAIVGGVMLEDGKPVPHENKSFQPPVETVEKSKKLPTSKRKGN